MTHQQPIDWELERARFPTCTQFVYYMSAANAPLSTSVYQAQREVIDLMHFDAHITWDAVNLKGRELRADLATLYGGHEDDWGFGANTSHNMNLLSLGLKESMGSLEVLSFEDEFPSSTIPWKYHGHKLRKIAHQENGKLEVDYILSALRTQTKVVVLSHVQYSTGFLADIETLGAELARRDIFFVINATQSLGIFPLNLAKSQASALVCSSHKWLGAGYGCSLLYTSEAFRAQTKWPLAGTLSYNDPSFKGDLENPRPGTTFMELGALPFIQILGVHASVKDILRIGPEKIKERVLNSTDQLCSLLQENGRELLFKREAWNENERSQLLFIKDPSPNQTMLDLRAQKILVNERAGRLRVSVNRFNNLEDARHLTSALAPTN